MVKQQILSGPVSGLKARCEEIVAGLDGEEFQVTRTAFSQILKMNTQSNGGYNFLIRHPSVGIEWLKQSNLPAPKVTIIKQEITPPKECDPGIMFFFC